MITDTSELLCWFLRFLPSLVILSGRKIDFWRIWVKCKHSDQIKEFVQITLLCLGTFSRVLRK